VVPGDSLQPAQVAARVSNEPWSNKEFIYSLGSALVRWWRILSVMVKNCLCHAYLPKEFHDIWVPDIVVCIDAHYDLLPHFYPGGEERPQVIPKLLSRVRLFGLVGVLSGEVSPVLLSHRKVAVIGF